MLLADPTMPTLSPHPPPSNTSVGDPSTPTQLDSLDVKPNISDLMGPKSVSSPNNQVSYIHGSQFIVFLIKAY